MATETCITCDIRFVVPDEFQRKRKEDHKSFFCPKGHSQYYPGESEKEKLKRLLKSAEDRYMSVRGSNIALRAVVTRQKNKALAPVTVEQAEKQAIKNALAHSNNNRQKAVELLQISERTLYRKIKKYGLCKNAGRKRNSRD